jgi:hypothetical protein
MDRDEIRYPRELYESYARHDVYPIERVVRDTRLAQIWTGTNEIMSAMIQHDLFTELRMEAGRYRDVERDAMHDDEAEKIFDEDDMWRVYERDA